MTTIQYLAGTGTFTSDTMSRLVWMPTHTAV